MPPAKKPKKADKKAIGLVERVTVQGINGKEEVLAKVDTGASRTAADIRLAAAVGLGPITDTVIIRGSTGTARETRAMARARISLGGKAFDLPVAITDRGDMKYPIIIGMDILGKGDFFIDATKRARLRKKRAKAE
jgi:hypothetical protein